MTIQLIPVFSGTISNETILLCNARDLHDFLEVGKVFAAWINARIEEYGFEENKDFVVFSNSGKNSVGRRRKDYTSPWTPPKSWLWSNATKKAAKSADTSSSARRSCAKIPPAHNPL